MRNTGLEETQAGIKIAGRNINNLRYADDNHPHGRKWRGTKELLDESVRGEWKSWLKAQHSVKEDHGIRSHHFMANRWGNSGNSVRLYFLVSKITAAGDCSHEIKKQKQKAKTKQNNNNNNKRLFLGRKVMTNLDNILRSRDITLPTKACLVKAMVFQ